MALLTNEEARRFIQLERKEKVARARTDILAFTELTHPHYKTNWHHRALAEKLNEFVLGDLNRLIVTMPPRYGKSELCSRRLPAFIFGVDPDAPIISTSYSATLASSMNRDVQRIIDDPTYQQIFPQTKIYSKQIRTMDRPLRNSERFEIVGKLGQYLCAGVGGGITGQGFKYGICDDPIKNYKEANSITFRNGVWNWWGSDFTTREEGEAKILIIQTRWHEDDLVGRIKELMKADPEADKYEIVNFPAILERKTKGDPREIGDPLWRAKFPLKKVQQQKKTMGSYKFNALHQQNPTPPEGTIIKRTWFKFWNELPDRFDEMIQSWDFAEGGEEGHFTVGGVFAKKGANIYMLDLVRDRWDTPESMREIRNTSEKWPEAHIKLLEKKSTGVAVIQMLSNEIPGIIEVSPTDSKPVRLKSCSPTFEARNFWLPNPQRCPWVYDVIEEICAMGHGGSTLKHDDIVDVVTQALLRWIDGAAGVFEDEFVPDESETLAPAVDEAW